MKDEFGYSMIYEILLNLREEFHRYGRIDDSNAKLDEIIKLICISFSLAKRDIKFDLEYVKNKSKQIFDGDVCIAKALRYIFSEECQNHMFYNDDKTNIFGANRKLNIQPTEDEFASVLIKEIQKIDFIMLLKTKKYSDFDLVNECFGHFVRENFRNNKEDAQYMTPYEVTTSILEIVFEDMRNDKYLDYNTLKGFKVMDPSCGVGTLLIESSKFFTKYIEKLEIPFIEKENLITNFRKNGVIGQDKVDRMVRLSKINMLLLGGNMSNIFSGNSIIGDSALRKYNQKVDMIFTNPPFGAEYQITELEMDDYPLLKKMDTSFNMISSELLLLDKCIGMLKDDGYLVIILPDSVFSAKGINEIYRKLLLESTEIRGIIDLPDLTFAQAGTRTKTSILYLRKSKKPKDKLIFMATCNDLGYVVKEKVGVPIKISKGKNQMPTIANMIITNRKTSGVICQEPSITCITKEQLIGNVFKASFYSANRFNALNNMQDMISCGYKLHKLSEVVEFVTSKRKLYTVNENVKHISVLHINSDCTINFREVEKYNPVSKGRVCKEGDLIFSKINPRIPRMAVIPKRKYDIVCSSEFEIMRPKGKYDIYSICFLLRTKNVAMQIENLTSGTSSSHSRIKREQLQNILIPIPVSKETQDKFNEINKKFKQSVDLRYKADTIMMKQLNYLESIF